MTGYPAQVTGVFSNEDFAPIPKGYSIFERLEKYFGRHKFTSAALIHKQGNMEKEPGKPYYFTARNMALFMNGLGERNVVLQADKFLKKVGKKQFFLFAHLDQIDETGHRYGEGSEEYKQAIINTDLATGAIIECLKKQGLYSKTLVYVTADHGFNQGKRHHHYAPDVFLVTNDSSLKATAGRNLDIVPTILARFGLDPSSIKPPLAGQPL